MGWGGVGWRGKQSKSSGRLWCTGVGESVGVQALFPGLVSLTLPGLSMVSMKRCRTSEISSQQELLLLSSPGSTWSPHILHSPPLSTLSLLGTSGPGRTTQSPGASLEAEKLEQKHHPEKLPRILELASVFFKGLWQLPTYPHRLVRNSSQGALEQDLVGSLLDRCPLSSSWIVDPL